MNYTAEVRWFLKDTQPDVLESLFKINNIVLTGEPTRTDWYLLNHDEEVSTKIRENKLEVKKMISTPEFFNQGETVQGYFQTWVKYGFNISGGEDINSVIRQELSPDWVPVTKKRLVARFEINKDSLQQVPAKTLPEEGCTLEIASVYLTEQSWCTVCIETSGSAGRMVENLKLAASTLLNKMPRNFQLPFRFSLSYPQFLNKIFYPE